MGETMKRAEGGTPWVFVPMRIECSGTRDPRSCGWTSISHTTNKTYTWPDTEGQTAHLFRKANLQVRCGTFLYSIRGQPASSDPKNSACFRQKNVSTSRVMYVHPFTRSETNRKWDQAVDLRAMSSQIVRGQRERSHDVVTTRRDKGKGG